MRITKFSTNEYYHVYNRGNNKRNIFLDSLDFKRFLDSISQFNTEMPIGSIYQNSFRDESLRSSTPKLVSIICYCLNPNHFHLLLKQRVDNGVSKFMHRVGTGYTNKFNLKYDGSGSLFQGRYKAIHINSNEYLLHLSSYINLNYEIHGLERSTSKSSLNEFIDNNSKFSICEKEPILSQFKNLSDYKKFAKDSLISIKQRRDVDDLLLE